jgi:SAM-dependent methyltransferase
MALTSKLGITSKSRLNSLGELDWENLEPANIKLFEMIRNSGRFPIAPGTRLLDIGSGDKGSDFVNRYAATFPGIEAVYLDNHSPFIERLKFPNKVLADATNMPFQAESFDLAYAGFVISSGVLKKCLGTGDESYRIAKEAHRILKQNGLFVFTYVVGENTETIFYLMGDDSETPANLDEIGFRELEHLQRWEFGKVPTDTYAVRK